MHTMPLESVREKMQEMFRLKDSVYLAGRYDRREELLGYSRELESMGYEIVSTWLDGYHDGLPNDIIANDDYADLLDAEIVIHFTETPEAGYNRGGRHVEFGLTYQIALRIIIVGPRENVFHWLPDVEQYNSWEEAKWALRTIQ